MLGSWLGITRSHRIRGWQRVHPVSQTRVHRDQQLAVDLRALIRGFRMPAAGETSPRVGRPASESLQGRKPRLGKGVAVLPGYGDLRAAGELFDWDGAERSSRAR